ncbi:membrane protein insertase YidC [Granulicella tundricola]|uniref:Membrane protein insertase YidC n=1 Tax=Granulicella tundricola (strain ATCC BAA-1859 / DSM 23138 / MP5ACTX9) TaxID=1198114 RepID=E8WWP1_GRATM|nr:membrane protein insertase YidC [Granulicella tundricola]ADW70786.1 membrane protein insertase, YidC/Oxa1 family [Granulicella tundricola MP5ACTX9]
MAEFRNPNQPGASQDNRSLFTIMAIMILVFAGLQFWRAKHNPQTASPNGQTQQQQANQPTPTVAASVAGQTIQVPAVQPVVAAAESTTVVENELYKITFSNKGAQATSWILKKYKDSYGQPLDLVHTLAAQTVGYPLSLYTYDPSLTASLNNALYLPSATGNITAPQTLTFKYVSGEYQVTKTFSFDDTYILHADTQVLRNGSPIRALVAWPGGFGDQEDAKSYGGSQVDYSQEQKEKHLAVGKVTGGNTLNGSFDWAGASDLYFAAIFLPDAPDSATVATLDSSIIVPKANRHNGLGHGVPVAPKGEPGKDEIKVPIIGAAVGDLSGHTQTRLFAGPKAVAVLRNVHSAGNKTSLEPLLDFGFFGIIGKYLFLALFAIHQYVTPNWGWCIVILTVLINLLILPLRIKTMQSGLKMQRIQPQMDAVKARYKNLKVTDPKRNEMNAEIMQLQKDNGVNMFGGCVPTLIQMPLLFAFFGMLPKVVELRQAHWFWLPDLSSADPYHILPILMVISQFLVQFYTPSPGVDPQQQKMMAFMMPVFSGYMTWNYSSGLALYWSVGNLISIATQFIMNKTSIGQEMREIAAKRARRKAGEGVNSKTIQGKTVKR